jgi:hypothetical protein
MPVDRARSGRNTLPLPLPKAGLKEQLAARQANRVSNLISRLPSPKESEYVWSDIWHLEAHHSTALEGNTLVLREVEVLLDKGRAVGAKPLREYMEIQGYGNAAHWVYAHAVDPGDWRAEGLIDARGPPGPFARDEPGMAGRAAP